MTPTDAPLSHLSGRPLLRSLAEHWWLVLLRGIAAVIFGVLAFVWPGITALTLVLLWGAYALVDGAFSLWAAIAGRGGATTGERWWLAVVGVLGLVAGVIAFLMPGLTAGVLLIVIAAWAIAIGVMAIIGAIQLRKEIEGEWLLILSGAIAIVFGVLMLAQPASGALAVIWMIGTFAIIFGIDLIWLAFKLKRFRQSG
jgi:uncharacterized membrane protein HdeD (DUF308 family)